MLVMSDRILRSNTKSLPDGSKASVKKSRKVILQSFDELSNTPKESENEEVYKKKIKKKRIRRTEHSFLIDDSCKGETTLNEQYNTESSKAKTKKLRRNDCSSSSGDDSVFESEGVSSKKTRKTKKKFKLPTYQLDDCQQFNNNKQKLRQESNANNSKSGIECNNTSYDFPVMVQNAIIEQSRKKKETTTNNSKKILVQTKINSRTDTKNPNISMSVATVPCGDVYLDNTDISMSKQNEEVPAILGKRERKRWTILGGNEAKKSFNAQMDLLRRSLLISSNNQNSPNNNDVKSRRSVRKRWSNELRKSVCALDISKNSKHNVDSKINSHSEDKLEISNGGNRLSTNSRRSRFSSNSSIDRSTSEFPKTTPNAPINNLSNSNINCSKRRTSELQKNVDSPLLMSPGSKISNRRSRFSSSSSIDRSTSDFPKTTPNVSIDNLSKSNINSSERTFEIEKNVGDSALLLSTSSKISNGRRSRFSSNSSIDRSTSEFPKTTPNAPINNLSNSNINCSKRRTSELQKNVDSPLLMSPGSKISNRRSRFSSSSSIDRSTSDFPKTTPNVSIDNLSKSNINSSERTFEIEKNVGDSALLLSTSSKISNGRRSRFSSSSSVYRSAVETTPNISIGNLSKSNINCSRRRTYEIQKNVDDSPLLIPTTSILSNGRHSRFLSDSVINTSATQSSKTAPFLSVDNLSKSNLNSSKRRTFEIEKSVYDSTLLMPNSSTSNERDYKDPVILNRRDTYELEESVADVNTLRALSESTLTDIGVGVLPGENSVDFSTSKKVDFGNVTRRKAFDRSVKEIEVANGHISLINKSSKRVCFKNSAPKKRSMSLEKPFSPRTFISSTPKCGFQSSSAQKSIITDKHLPLSRRRSKSADEGNTRITRIRMPNFAKIHQKAREKMENIVQLTERKAERAKLLLSGQKPNDSHGVLNSDNNVKDVKRSHKQLTYDSSKPSTSRGFLRVYQDNTKKDQLKVPGTKIPVFNEPKSQLSKDVNLKVTVSEKHKNVGKPRLAKALSLKNVTQFGFKIKSDACSDNKPEQLKALATKTKLKQDNRAEQRSILKGVRSNKRFELLMKMRKK